MKISIVIPVYNEATSLIACLDSISRQSITPWQVIVVDNNSTDESASIAEQYDFVSLLHESKQGVLHARTKGFDAASGEIIARIDADSILSDDWLESIIRIFQNPEVDAVSGVAKYYNVAYASFFDKVDLFFRRRLSRQLGNRNYLWGANMAIRRSSWIQTKPHLCNIGGIHEDFDIAIHLQELGGKVVFDERIEVEVSSRRIDTNFASFIRYAMTSPQTYAKHGIRQRFHMYPVIVLCILGYLPARFLYRGYDASTDNFRWSKLVEPAGSVPRVDPTSNVA